MFAQLLWNRRLRISEGLQLRVKDLDFDHGTIIVQGWKPDQCFDVAETFQPRLILAQHGELKRVKAVRRAPKRERKYPRAGHSWPWFWVFAQHTHSTDPQAVSCVAITCMTRPFSAPSAARQNESRYHDLPAPTPSLLVRVCAATQRLRHSNRAGSARPFRRLYIDDLRMC